MYCSTLANLGNVSYVEGFSNCMNIGEMGVIELKRDFTSKVLNLVEFVVVSDHPFYTCLQAVFI